MPNTIAIFKSDSELSPTFRNFFAVSHKEASQDADEQPPSNAFVQAQKIVSQVASMPGCRVSYAHEEVGDIQFVAEVDDTAMWDEIQPRIVANMVKHLGWQNDYTLTEQTVSDS
jgi:hypothetical protein